MSARRRKILPRLINQRPPPWAQQLLAGGPRPAEGDADFDAWFGWCFCGDAVPGLPDPMSAAGLPLWSERTEPCRSGE